MCWELYFIHWVISNILFYGIVLVTQEHGMVVMVLNVYETIILEFDKNISWNGTYGDSDGSCMRSMY